MLHQYNCYKNILILKKTRKKERQSIVILNLIALAKVVQISKLVNFAEKYIQLISNIDINTVKKLGLTSNQKS